MKINSKQINLLKAQAWALGFRAGLEFLYDRFYFLVDEVERRIENGDLSEYTRLDEKGYPAWDEDKWEAEVNEYIAKQQAELYLEEKNQQEPFTKSQLP